ncbi:Xcc1710-like domain-containing protein [Luteibacter jiangsuensis]|uniref:Xcc1710-like domain-containing protein n=1 Tax=Luteibacter jiangsuensis TaxID=637577 RepID=A0ABX0Q8W1_9GAMM|nr:Mth938-like domain-containing protein [Luteibacter jiangsuensis]NID06998.1 Xcc1710-like domain-containing protein [Luteibacter jiangsuensis]
MDLSFEHPGDYLFVRRVGAGTVTVVDRDFHKSILLTPQQVVEDWEATDAARLTLADVEKIAGLQPELVLLGTGERQVFPPAEVMAGFLRRGIGIEAMTNGSAARTYSLLAGEGRKVVAAFILP